MNRGMALLRFVFSDLRLTKYLHPIVKSPLRRENSLQNGDDRLR
jgi:hypothetical protein